jgi:hypothetical protein
VKQALLMVLALLVSGCSDSAEAPTLTCSDGQVKTVVDGSEVCQDPPPPVRVELGALPGSMGVYERVTLAWTLQSPGPAHTMRTEARVSAASGQPTGPDTYGEKIGGKEHQDFQPGARFDAEWKPTSAGTYYVRAYALVNGSDYWSNETLVQVTAAQPTDRIEAVTIAPGGPVAASASPTPLMLDLGDGMVFQNDDVFAHTFTWSGPVAMEPTVAALRANTQPIHFLVPGSYRYTSNDAVPITGEVQVAEPGAAS